jgi:predicted phage terminase large subunit-like protein
MTAQAISNISPQGPQDDFLRTSAHIAIYGGAAGGGKTFALLMEALRYRNVRGFGAVIFRRNAVQVRNKGGLWDTSYELFPSFGGTPKESIMEWEFASGATVKFNHMEHEKSKLDWQGSQIPFIGFDELTHFTRDQFFYMLSRNRSTCGVKPYIRATTNPDCDSWVRELIDWWINPDTGYAIPERSGKIRWFIMESDRMIWANTAAELIKKTPDCLPKSFTFICSTVFDNKILMEKDPGYISNLKALPRFEREQLLMGNWNIRPTAGIFFQRSYFEIVKAIPNTLTKVRYWDRAATRKTETNDPDYTVGIKLEKDKNNVLYVTDLVRLQDSPLGVQNAIKNTASQDGRSVRIGIEQDPGQAGVSEADYLVRMLQGHFVKAIKATKDKVTRSLPISSQAEAGNIKILQASWNEAFLRELENFPEGSHDDIVDALSGAFLMLTDSTYDLRALTTM